MRRIFYPLLALFMLLNGPVRAESVDAAAFFGLLQDSPELQAARASVAVAEAALEQARKPVALDASATAQTRSDPLVADAPVTSLSTGVTAYPFNYGAQGEVVRTRELELEQARLNHRQALVRLEVKALRSAFEVQLNRQALALARRGVGAARHVYETTELRYARGVATAAEVRSADAELRRKQNLVSSLSANLELSETTLTALVGSARLRALPELKPPAGTPFSLRSSDVALELARVGASGATRPFYPVADVTYNLDVSAQSRVSASVSTRDLAPRVGYSFVSDGYDDGVGLYVRLSATISPEQFHNVTRLEQAQAAAEANLRAAQRDAAAQEGLLANRVEETARNEQLAVFIFENAERALQEARQRQALGITTPLETRGAVLTLVNAGAAPFDSVYEARRQHLTALLDLYEFYALPPSGRTP